MEEHEPSNHSESADTAAEASFAQRAPLPNRPPPAPAMRKSPGLAVVLSMFPGLGHVYCGLYSRALMFFAAFVGSIQMIGSAGAPMFGLALAFFWLFGVVDAYRQATLMNLGYATDLGIARAPQAGKPGQEILITGVVLFSLGLLELLSRLRIWDWELLVDHAYLLLMVVGAWLVATVLLRRRKAAQEELIQAFPEA
ncbi:MAG: hypothetical protein KDD47_04900 [Acidobacteria bacterium]|nr:hypothetical protein [Acidobacteriota bacterium]